MSLEEAMKLEQEYLESDDHTKFYFHEKMELAGYKDLDQYHREKEEYLFTHSKIQVKDSAYDVDVFWKDIATVIDVGEEAVFFFYPKEDSVFIGSDGFNEKYCTDNKITAYKLSYSGCTSVTTKEDLAFVFVLKNPEMDKIILGRLAKALGAEISGNDLVIKGQKVVGGAKTKYKGYFIYLYQAVFKPNETLNSAVRLTTAEKPSISITNISRDDLVKEIKSWLQ